MHRNHNHAPYTTLTSHRPFCYYYYYCDIFIFTIFFFRHGKLWNTISWAQWQKNNTFQSKLLYVNIGASAIPCLVRLSWRARKSHLKCSFCFPLMLLVSIVCLVLTPLYIVYSIASLIGKIVSHRFVINILLGHMHAWTCVF